MRINMKKLFISLSAVAIWTAAYAAPAATVLRYADYGPNRGQRAEALHWFANQIEERTNGDVTIRFYWSGALLSASSLLDGVSSGVADMGTVIGFVNPKRLYAYTLGDLPMKNSNVWVMLRSFYELSKTSPMIQREFNDAGVHYVTNFTTGPIQFICTVQIDSVEDLQGLNVRASGPYGKILSELGANVQTMSQPDVYQALDSGLLTCNQNYYYAMRSYKQYEVAHEVTELNWGQNASFGIIMNDGAYARLTDEQKAIFNDVSKEFVDYFAKTYIVQSKSDKKEMVAGVDGDSVSVTNASKKLEMTLEQHSREYLSTWKQGAARLDIDADKLIEKYKNLIEKYERSYRKNGYPWTR